MSTPEGNGPGELSLAASSPANVERAGTPPVASPGVGLAATRIPAGPTLPDADIASLTLAISNYANGIFGSQALSILPVPTLGDTGAETRAPVQQGSVPPASVPAGSVPAGSVPAGSVPAGSVPKEVGSQGGVPQGSDPQGSTPHGNAPQGGIPQAAPREPAAPSGLPSADATPAASPANPFFAPLNFAPLALDADEPAFANRTFTLPLLDEQPAVTAGSGAEAPAAPHREEEELSLDRSLFEVRPVVEDLPPSRGGFDAAAIRREFPILEEKVHGRRLVWLDNAATTQKPRAVIERLVTFYERENSNIHRAAHTLAARATDAYEAARESVRRFVNASSVRDVVFVRGTTEGINLVAQSWGRRNVSAGDEIVVTHLEHHANIVPWQMLCAEKGARLRVAPVDDSGQIRLDEYEKLLNDRTKIVALSQVSNALGTVTPAAKMIEIARRRGIRVLLDGAQSVSHMRVDLAALGCDFFVFSGHKVFGPTGIGAVVAPAALLDETPPWQGGGNMIQDVTFERTVYQNAPARFEAGTGNIADAVGLGAALDWLSRIGIENVERHEHDLLAYGTRKLLGVPGLRIVGTAAEKAGVLSFVLAGHDTQAVSTFLDKQGIAVRGGHHCAQPILRRFGLESTVRASLALYNTTDDLDALADALGQLVGGNESGTLTAAA